LINLGEKGFGITTDAIFEKWKTRAFTYNMFTEFMGERDSEQFEQAMLLIYDHSRFLDPQ